MSSGNIMLHLARLAKIISQGKGDVNASPST
jgi:hypothetical protein